MPSLTFQIESHKSHQPTNQAKVTSFPHSPSEVEVHNFLYSLYKVEMEDTTINTIILRYCICLVKVSFPSIDDFKVNIQIEDIIDLRSTLKYRADWS